ncbi:restriction endonuclease [Streptomyces sp. H10-C2]|uniref:restriction endonuclease n=1 Tax=unclassified Streptomyces TaxID=2593676 RepID=UPI0024B95628|nr:MULTISPECIES: restriction endonuclease [unclassified Streptomyces]MDJ0340424.1 restriction endonuclease [Streptomyces sp. PH10-H1]MDJ0368128.1 restriction endonuclease [Streptomyces sp. H10-C2]
MRRRRHKTALWWGFEPASVVGGGIVFFLACLWVGQWLFEHAWVLGLALAVALFLFALWLQKRLDRAKWAEARARGLRMQLDELDSLHHRQFETAIRDLMRRDGFKAEQMGGAGDDACDVRAVDADGRVWAIQAKHRRDGMRGSATGTPVLQQVKGTAGPVHGAQFAVVITNGRFTANAVAWGKTHGIHLVDRHKLAQWAAGSQPLWEVLGRISPPRRLPNRPGSFAP